MTKPGHTDTRDLSASAAVLSRANSAVDDLIDGKPVSAERLDAAKDAFLNTLWEGKPAARHTAQYGLVAIYRRSADPADRAELLGELFAAGEHGRDTLQELASEAPSAGLTAGEVTAFLQDTKLTVQQRLHIIAGKLERESGHRVPGHSAPRAAGEIPLEAFVNPVEQRTRAGRVVAQPSDPPDGGDALNDLKDEQLSPERRNARAFELGRAAVPPLADMLLHAQPAEREFAVATLIRLGRTPAAARAVHLAMQRIEINHPDARRAAEFVRDAIDNAGGQRDGGVQPRERERAAGVGHGWLREALDSCDSENILKAAAGREVLAIALGMRALQRTRAAKP